MKVRFIYGILVMAAVVSAMASTAAFCADPPQPQAVSPLGNKDPDKSETAIGSLVADALRDILHVDAAFVAASEIKPKDTPIPAGKLSTADIEPLVSYPDDPLAIVQLKGKTIKQALEKSVSIYPQPNLSFLQVSGIEFAFDPKKPTGERVTSVKIGASSLDENATYRVAMTNSIANGALGYWRVWEQDTTPDRKTNLNLVSAIESYLKANQKLDYSTLDRITAAK